MGYIRKEEVKEGENESEGEECEGGKDFYSWGEKTCDIGINI